MVKLTGYFYYVLLQHIVGSFLVLDILFLSLFSVLTMKPNEATTIAPQEVHQLLEHGNHTLSVVSHTSTIEYGHESFRTFQFKAVELSAQSSPCPEKTLRASA
jgi:hypothetical protein